MKVAAIIDERFDDYKLPALMIAACNCDWKCAHDGGFPEEVCQNNELAGQVPFEVTPADIYQMYVNNPITQCVVFGGLEPMLQLEDLIMILKFFREEMGDQTRFVIYTGYTAQELEMQLRVLREYKNIIVKFGRFVPNQTPHFDAVLGVKLASDNQYAEIIS